jgi:MFS family permease
MKLPRAIRALAYRNFRLFFFGQTVSLIGTWMQQVAILWVVHKLTDSPLAQGVVTFAGQVPAFFIAPVAGVMVDRWDRQRLVVGTQTLAMLQAFALAWLALSGTVEMWQLVVLSIFMGVINAFDMTGRQAFLSEMIGSRDDLANAIALNSSMFNGARLVGPALAALLLTWTSPGVCFLANGISYIAVIFALLAMKVAPRERPPRRKMAHEFREGVAYAFGFPPIRAMLSLLTVVSVAGMSYSVLVPHIAAHVLHGDVGTFGLLMTSAGVGALAGAIYMAARKTVLGLGRWLVVAPMLAGVGLFLLGGIPKEWVWSVWSSLAPPLGDELHQAFVMLLLALIGFSLMVYMASTNTLLQTIVDEDKRGRVMSLYMMAFMGVAPLGSLLVGWLATVFEDPGNALRIAGVVCCTGAAVFATQRSRLREFIRPIYVRMGILPGEVPSLGPNTAITLAEPVVTEIQPVVTDINHTQ